eukprot:CAMPEP_0175036518 /NCGR_PEP_ID=MMETSP0005-20121125/23831_1 /TAXON_ID=420556 /ORGANISM="Ochromonas sp., Strain CCMP1393" /LENGTH=159 /DNA_ID=CAMNT_0016297719 /DNA_START=303 /DNA_END=782 /DNA_ORIENTATION=+
MAETLRKCDGNAHNNENDAASSGNQNVGRETSSNGAGTGASIGTRTGPGTGTSPAHSCTCSRADISSHPNDTLADREAHIAATAGENIDVGISVNTKRSISAGTGSGGFGFEFDPDVMAHAATSGIWGTPAAGVSSSSTRRDNDDSTNLETDPISILGV